MSPNLYIFGKIKRVVFKIPRRMKIIKECVRSLYMSSRDIGYLGRG